ncbi:MAG TPA: alpha-L-rhamnosidase C-terminal domain-containing protein, partial [Fimbriimonadaceae bacterium]|nr:alpha-L-rhamnosidase C-terminal domain-containing protein [Fimbriimonadaceae bacterium]
MVCAVALAVILDFETSRACLVSPATCPEVRNEIGLPWTARLDLGTLTVPPWRPATPQPAMIKDYGLKPYIRTSRFLPHSEDKAWKLVCEMPYNCQFQPSIEIEAPAGQVIKFNSTNPLVLYLTPTETCTTEAGDHVYEAKNWISGEGAIYTIPPGVVVKAVKFRETGYDTSFAGSFECSDEDYNILWRRAARTAYLCMRDHFYDCPDRERTGFWGDGTPELDQCFYIFDTKSHQICRDLLLRPLQPTFYPGQILEFLGEYGLWFYYMQTGDLASLASVYEPTKTFLLHTYKFGDAGTWFDWGVDSKDTAVVETCFAYLDLKTLRKIALLTGHQADLPEIDSRIEGIRGSFDVKYWKGAYYQSSDVKTPDDRANAMAVNAGLAGADKWDAIYRNVLATTTNSSCFFDRWVFEALCKMGRQDDALVRMATRYRTMIDSSFSTLWEHYDRWWASWLNAFDEGSSLNHGWNPPALLLSYDIAGVRPVDPGWTTYEVMPKEAFLSSIKATVPTVKGLVKVAIGKTKKTYTVDLDSPAGTAAIVGIPKGSFTRLDSVSLDGKQIWKGGEAAVTEDGYLKFRLPPGRSSLVARGVLTSTPWPPPPFPRQASTRPGANGRGNGAGTFLDKHDWRASASVPDGSFLFSGAKIPIDVSAANAIDGDHWTGWRDMTGLQHPGQWFEVDMKREQAFDGIVLDCTW